MSVSTPINGIGGMAVQLCSPTSPQSASSVQSTLVAGSELILDGAGDSSLALSTDGGGGGDDSNSGYSDDEVRTLFVSGLPMDARPRELHLLFRAYKGYETSLLKISGKNGKTTTPVGFVTFSTRADAEAAKEDLQRGVKFDPDLPQTLRLEFARSNTKMTKPRQLFPPSLATTVHPALAPTAAYIHPFAATRLPDVWAINGHHLMASPYPEFSAGTLHHSAATTLFHPAISPAGPHMAMPIHPAMLAGGHTFNTIATSQPGSAVLTQQPCGPGSHSPVLANSATVHVVSANGGPGTAMKSFSPAVPTGNLSVDALTVTSPINSISTPSSTLFVANIGSNTTDNDLREIFGVFPGFSRVRLHCKSGLPIAFVEYTDYRFATDAMQRLQGARLYSDHSGIRIEYARNKLGDSVTRKDVIRIASHDLNHVTSIQ